MGTRIDLRPQNSAATQAGMRGVHRGMSGNVIGGYTAEGQALGTKATQGGGLMGSGGTGLRQRPESPQMGQWGGTPAATGNQLNARQNLFKSMETAGAKGLTPEMRASARRLGVSDDSFNSAAGRIAANDAVTPRPQPNPNPNPNPNPAPNPNPNPNPTPPATGMRTRAGKIDGKPAAEVISAARAGASEAVGGEIFAPYPLVKPAGSNPAAPQPETSDLTESANRISSAGVAAKNIVGDISQANPSFATTPLARKFRDNAQAFKPPSMVAGPMGPPKPTPAPTPAPAPAPAEKKGFVQSAMDLWKSERPAARKRAKEKREALQNKAPAAPAAPAPATTAVPATPPRPEYSPPEYSGAGVHQ
jgi:hypothetical protein